MGVSFWAGVGFQNGVIYPEYFAEFARSRSSSTPSRRATAGTRRWQDRLTLLDAHSAEVPEEREFSLRLLRHLASSVRHEQYHDTEIVTVRVDTPRAP